ncbi:MAG: superoxide dismutase, partial [Bacteroidota bacterium]
MKHELPELPYPKKALEPHISETTLEYHHGKHHQKYVDNLNDLIQGTEFEDADLEEIIKKADGGIFNNGAQVWNHTFYWNCMKPASEGDNQPSPEFRSRLEKDFGSFEEFIESFSNAATSLFGSGWVWLVKKNDRLEIVQKDNAGNPIRDG